MGLIDLHTHSICSDGTLSPKELIKYAKEKNLVAIALTDHDTVEGLKEASEEAERLGIELIPGVEIAAEFNGSEIHILGLFIDINSNELKTALDDMKVRRETRNKKLVELFNAAGIDMTYNEVVATAQGNIITRAHFAKVLVKRGYGESISEVFKAYLSPGSDTYIMRELFSYEEAIQLIHKAGGFAVLAHPKEYRIDKKETDAMVKLLKKEGLDGIEAIYTTNAPEDEAFQRFLAEKYNLFITGGSDFHGENKPKIDLGVGFGKLRIPEAIILKIKKLHNL